MELCQNKSVWPQFVESPNLKLRIKACPHGVVLSRKTQRDKVRVGRPLSPLFGKHQSKGVGRGLAQGSSPRLRASAGGPVLVQRPHCLLFGARNLREGGAGDCPGQAFREREKRTLIVSPCSQPLAPGSTAVL